VLVLFIT